MGILPKKEPFQKFSSFPDYSPAQQLQNIEKPPPESKVLEEFQARPYSFNFGVTDVYSGVDHNRVEERSDQGITRGSYKVSLPDGRIQTVSYIADDSGFHATVTYEGEQNFPKKRKVPEPIKQVRKSHRESKKVRITVTTFFKKNKSFNSRTKQNIPGLSVPHENTKTFSSKTLQQNRFTVKNQPVTTVAPPTTIHKNLISYST